MATNTWPNWECVRLLGSGSFGSVYEIRRTEFGKEFSAALKVITIPSDDATLKQAYSEGMDEESVTQYFQSYVQDIAAEFAMMSDLKGHTNIVSYEDHMVKKLEDRFGWEILIRMELLTPLIDWVKTHPLTETEVIKLGIDMCRALEVCHNQNILHRDIKPENIFINRSGDYKLGDFGIAKKSAQTISALSQKGTYTYMAPEVYLGQPYGRTADIYSLGTVLYRYINEQRTPFLPYGAIKYTDRDNALKMRMSGQPVPAPKYGSEKLKAAVLKSIAFEQSDRFPNATAMREALEACLAYCKENGDSLANIAASEQASSASNDGASSFSPDFTTPAVPETPAPAVDKTVSVFEETQPVTQTPAPAPAPKQKKKWILPAAIGGGVLLLIGIIALASGKKSPDSSAGSISRADYSSEVQSSSSLEDSSSAEKSSSSAADESEAAESKTENADLADFKGDQWELKAHTGLLLPGDETEVILCSSESGFWMFDSHANGMKWSSSDENVLKVNAGSAKAVNAGTAKVLCDYGEWHYEYTMTVADSENDSGCTIEADYPSISMANYAESDVTLTINGVKDFNVLWYTDPPTGSEDPLTSLFCTWGELDGNTLPMTVKTMYAAKNSSRVITVLVYDNDNNVLASQKIKVRING